MSEIEAIGRTIRIVFTEGAVRDLHLEASEYEFQISGEEIDVTAVQRTLRKILTCGRPDFIPGFWVCS